MTTYLTAPDGSRWAVVPVKPTRDMWLAATIGKDDYWHEMLAAAPQFPVEAMVETLRQKMFSHAAYSERLGTEKARAVLAALFSEVKP